MGARRRAPAARTRARSRPAHRRRGRHRVALNLIRPTKGEQPPMHTRRPRYSDSRRQFLGRAGLVAGAFAFAPSILAACGGDDDSVSASGKGKQCPSPTQSTDKTLAISNWPLYIDKNTVSDFEKATGIKTTYKEDYNDNDEYYAKVRPTLKECNSIGRDMIVSTDWMAARLINLGWIAKIDSSKIPNKSNLLDTLKSPTWDP